MFAYCLNNPVNRIDIGGAASIWYYLMVDHDMGYVHRMVQLHIRENNRNISTEWILTGFGRADVVDTTLGVVWEVKHAGKIPEARTTEATLQALSYVGGKHGRTTITGLGEPHAFTGQFHITIEGNLYLVTYETPAPGVILYTVKEVQNNPNEATANAYAHAYTYSPKNNNERTGVAMLGTIALGFGGGSSRFCFSKDYQGYELTLGG
jgi:hypothetical protein